MRRCPDPETCAPCGLEIAKADRLGGFLAVLQNEDEPLVLLTHLLRWCRDEHRILWEHVQRNPNLDPQQQIRQVAWPPTGTQPVVDQTVRESMARVLKDAGTADPPVGIARTLAVLLDEHYWTSFRDSFARRSPYQPGVGDPIPLDSLDLRAVTQMTPTSPRWRLANRLDETQHVRLAGEWAVQYRVIFDYSASAALAGIVSRDTVVATCHPNNHLDELVLGDASSPWLFPVGPCDSHRQAELIDGLIQTACDAGASIVVLPELATTKRAAAALESWVRREDGPALIVTGSYHEEIRDVEHGGARRVNTALTWLRGHREPLRHHKHSPGDRPKPEGIQPQGWPELRVYVGADGVHLVVAVCRDLLNPSAVHALTECGANLVLVPAMSETLTPFVGSAANLVTSAQAVVAVSNNPAVWATTSDEAARRPARGLFGHPGLGALTRLVQSPDVSAGVALMRVSSGQLNWIPVTEEVHRVRQDGVPAPGPSWLRSLAQGDPASRSSRDPASSPARPRRAAVLVLLSALDGELSVLLTRRASDLAAYPGTIAFPGGHVEEGDRDIVETALREAREEVGLDPDTLTVIGAMAPLYAEATDAIVHPVLAWRRSAQDAWSMNHAEVDALAEVPLRAYTQTASSPGPALSLLGEPDQGSGFDLRSPMGDLTRTILDRLVSSALRDGALGPSAPSQNLDAVFADSIGCAVNAGRAT